MAGVVAHRDGIAQQREHRPGLLGRAVEIAFGIAAVLGALGVRSTLWSAPRAGAAAVLKYALWPELCTITSGVSGATAIQPCQGRIRQSVLQQRVPAVEKGAVGTALGNLGVNRVEHRIRIGHGDRTDVDDAPGQRHRLHQRMPVRLNETRHDAARDLADIGIRADPRRHLRAGADRDDASGSDTAIASAVGRAVSTVRMVP